MGQKEAILRTAGASLFSIPPGPLTAGLSPRPLEGPPPAESRTPTPHEEVHPHAVRTSYGNPAAPKRPCPSVRVQLAFPWALCPAGGTPMAGAGTGTDLGSGHVSNCLGFCMGPAGWGGCQAGAFVPRGVLGVGWGWLSFLLSFLSVSLD